MDTTDGAGSHVAAFYCEAECLPGYVQQRNEEEVQKRRQIIRALLDKAEQLKEFSRDE